VYYTFFVNIKFSEDCVCRIHHPLCSKNLIIEFNNLNLFFSSKHVLATKICTAINFPARVLTKISASSLGGDSSADEGKYPCFTDRAFDND
jgi:hypothetical protein